MKATEIIGKLITIISKEGDCEVKFLDTIEFSNGFHHKALDIDAVSFNIDTKEIEMW